MSDFSIRMNGDDGLAPPVDLFPLRPDPKGPKTIAILLILGGVLMCFVGYGDIQLSGAEDLTQDELDTLLTNVRNQGENISDEEYQDFHDEVQETSAYSIRGWSVLTGGVLVVSGGIVLLLLRSLGSKLALGGAMISLVGGVYANNKIAEVSELMLPDSLVLANELMMYLCGVCMVMCAAMAALPLVNASARAALDNKVELIIEEE